MSKNKKTQTKKPSLAQKLRANPGFKWWACLLYTSDAADE